MGDVVVEAKNALPEMKYLQLVLIKAPTFLQTIHLLVVSQEQQTVVPVQAGKLWAIDPSATPVAPRVMQTMYCPVMGEVWAKLNPILNELYTKILGDAIAAENIGKEVVMVASVKVLSIPQKSNTLGETVLIAIWLTVRALFCSPLSITLPEINSVQYALIPLTEQQTGLLIEVEILIACPATTLDIAKVIVERSEEILQKMSTAAEAELVAADWQSPINEKSIIEVPVLCTGVRLSQQMEMLKLPPFVLETEGVRQISQEQIAAGTVA